MFPNFRLCIKALYEELDAQHICWKELHQLVYQSHQRLGSKSKQKYFEIAGSDLILVEKKVNLYYDAEINVQYLH